MLKLFRLTFVQRGFRLCGGLLIAGGLMLWLMADSPVMAQPPRPPLLKGGVEERSYKGPPVTHPRVKQWIEEACKAFRELLELNRMALERPELTESQASRQARRDAYDKWGKFPDGPPGVTAEEQAEAQKALQAGDVKRFNELSPREVHLQAARVRPILECTCPVVSGSKFVEELWKIRNDPRERAKFDRYPPGTVANLVKNAQSEVEGMLACYKKACEEAGPPSPPVLQGHVEKTQPADKTPPGTGPTLPPHTGTTLPPRTPPPSQPPGTPPTEQPQQDCDCVSPAAAAVLADVRSQMAALQAQADSLHSDFLSGTTLALTGFVTPAARPQHADPAGDVVKAYNAVVKYLKNDNAANHKALYQGAQNAVNAVRARPLYYAGQIYGPKLVCHTVSGGFRACGTAIRGLSSAEDAAATRAAANSLKDTVQVGADWRTKGLTGAPPGCGPGALVEVFNPDRQLNPSNQGNACFWSNVARDQNLKGIPNPATGRPWTVDDFVPPSGPNPDATASGRQLLDTLTRVYGDANANGYGPTPPKKVSANRLQIQSDGTFTRMIDKRAVESDLRNRGPGARSLVRVQVKPELLPRDPTGKVIGPNGHLFTHENHPLQGIHAVDALSGEDASGWYDNAADIWVYSVQ